MKCLLLVQRYTAKAFLLCASRLAAFDSPRYLFANDHLLAAVTLDALGSRTIPVVHARGRESLRVNAIT